MADRQRRLHCRHILDTNLFTAPLLQTHSHISAHRAEAAVTFNFVMILMMMMMMMMIIVLQYKGKKGKVFAALS
jgi:hypothetical protein